MVVVVVYVFCVFREQSEILGGWERECLFDFDFVYCGGWWGVVFFIVFDFFLDREGVWVLGSQKWQIFILIFKRERRIELWCLVFRGCESSVEGLLVKCDKILWDLVIRRFLGIFEESLKEVRLKYREQFRGVQRGRSWFLVYFLCWVG